MSTVESLQKEVDDLRKEMKNLGTQKKPKVKRGASGANIYIGEKSKELRSKTPSLAPKDALSQAAKKWATETEKVKNSYNEKAKKAREATVKEE